MDAYGDLVNEQRERVYVEKENSDGWENATKMRTKKTFSKAPAKLFCDQCKVQMLTLGQEKEFFYCVRCWMDCRAKKDGATRYELCPGCFRRSEVVCPPVQEPRATEPAVRRRNSEKRMRRRSSTDSELLQRRPTHEEVDGLDAMSSAAQGGFEETQHVRRYVEPTPEYGLPAGVAAEISIPIRYAAPAHPAA